MTVATMTVFHEDRHELAEENAAKKRVLPHSDIRETHTRHRENENLSLTLRAGKKYTVLMQRYRRSTTRHTSIRKSHTTRSTSVLLESTLEMLSATGVGANH